MSTSRLQFRGISRTPSDRMTTDGGCSESLNVVLDQQEIVPATHPKDITAELGLPTDKAGWELIYIHKTSSYTNYLVLNGNELGTWEQIESGKYTFNQILALDEEDISSITSIGNTVVLSTQSQMRYLLYNGGMYVDLGSKTPFPAVSFYEKNLEISSLSQGAIEGGHLNISFPEKQYKIPDSNDQVKTLAEAAVRSAINTFESTVLFNTLDNGINSDEIAARIHEYAKKLINDRRSTILADRGNRRYYPFFVLYSIALNDGSEIFSIPILVHPGPLYNARCKIYINTKISAESSGGNFTYYYNNIADEYSIALDCQTAWDLYAEMAKDDYDRLMLWADIITALNIYVSDEIIIDDIFDCSQFEIDLPSEYDVSKESVQGMLTWGKAHQLLLRFGTEDQRKEGWKEAILSMTNFRLVKSLSPSQSGEKISSLLGGRHIEAPVRSEDINILPALDWTLYRPDRNTVTAKQIFAYNNRLILSNITESQQSGPVMINAIRADGENKITFQYAVRRLSNNGVHSIIYARNNRNNLEFEPHIGYDINNTMKIQQSFGFLVWPASRCDMIYIKATEYSYDKDTGKWNTISKRQGQFEMSDHPYIPNLSYSYIDVTECLWDNLSEDDGTYKFPLEDNINVLSNRIYHTDVDQPFIFPDRGRYTISSGEILGIAIATKALSSGQFGQFPLYVFSSDGIWVMETAADGTFASAKPLSREICSNPESIIPIDQAIIFVTQKGVMLLDGNSTTLLSDNMDGKHYALDGSLIEIMKGTQWEPYTRSMSDDESFSEFISEASIVYDYTGKRIILFSPHSSDYQYVYMLGTATWHKISMTVSGEHPQLKRILNSYPSCYLSVRGCRRSMVIDMSTVLDVSSRERTTGIVISRPFDMGNPDIMKVIRDIRIRGNFSRGAVSYALLGSQDGICWRMLRSLGSGSFKLFRIVLFTDLFPDERISWVDIDFITRFTNKLR